MRREKAWLSVGWVCEQGWCAVTERRIQVPRAGMDDEEKELGRRRNSSDDEWIGGRLICVFNIGTGQYSYRLRECEREREFLYAVLRQGLTRKKAACCLMTMARRDLTSGDVVVLLWLQLWSG